MTPIEQAAREYIRRQARERSTREIGRYDNGGRYHIAADLRRSCCDRVLTPSRSWPWSELVHVASALHVAAEYGVERASILRSALILRSETGSAVVGDLVALGTVLAVWALGWIAMVETGILLSILASVGAL